jgi:intracellular septation protein
MAATAVAIVATLVQVLITWIKNHKVEKVHLITLILVTVLGGTTLILQDEIFFKWKPTVVNWLFGITFLGSQFIGKKNLAERAMGAAINVPVQIWAKINLSWAFFFITMGFLNLYVVYNFDTDTWVDFKFYGMLGLTFAFAIAQAFYLSRFAEEKSSEGE